jgi:hypothetical protein
MSKHQDYMDSRMLHAFMDGELGDTHEHVLFEKLSHSPGLRAEMHDHLAIRKAIQHDNEAYTPPSTATAAIFTTLGFSIPSAAAAAPAAAAGAGVLTRNLFFGVASSLIALLTALVLYLLFPLSVQDAVRPVERVVSVPPATIVLEEIPALADLPVATAVTTHNNDDATPVAPIPVQASPPPAAAQRNVLTAPERDITPHRLAGRTFAGGEGRYPDRVNATQVRFFDILPTPDGLTLYARNIALQSDPAPTMLSQHESWFHNVNLGLLYALDKHQAIGIEAGREAFSQHFSGMEDGLPVFYEQNPLVYWATAVYQLTGDAMLPHVHPFLQVQAGGAFHLGPLGRAMAGFKLKPYDRLAVIVGMEGNILMYRFQNNWFSTKKTGDVLRSLLRILNNAASISAYRPRSHCTGFAFCRCMRLATRRGNTPRPLRRSHCHTPDE